METIGAGDVVVLLEVVLWPGGTFVVVEVVVVEVVVAGADVLVVVDVVVGAWLELVGAELVVGGAEVVVTGVGVTDWKPLSLAGGSNLRFGRPCMATRM